MLGSDQKEMLKEDMIVSDGANASERNFDLNADVNDNEDTKAAGATATTATTATSTATATATATTVVDSSSSVPTTETNHEEYPGWSVSEMDKMAIDPLQLAQLGTRLDEEEEDYDEEG